MAGSYNHCVDAQGRLLGPEALNEMLENGGDVYEAVEELFGMVWYLGSRLAEADDADPAVVVEEAREEYDEGLELSPGRLYRSRQGWSDLNF